jgi:hypothetical protein
LLSACLCVPHNVSSQRLGKYFSAERIHTKRDAVYAIRVVSNTLYAVKGKKAISSSQILSRLPDRQKEECCYESRGTWKQKSLYRRERAAMYSINRRTDYFFPERLVYNAGATQSAAVSLRVGRLLNLLTVV